MTARMTRIISLTTIPPRFAGLSAILQGLLGQGADRVVLCVPHHWDRFPGRHDLPSLPDGVEVLRTDDHGPATKVLPVRAAYPEADILYCDDDCLYQPGWLDALVSAPGVRAASCFDVTRLRRKGGMVAQGFAGVRVPPDAPLPSYVPKQVRAADDLWLSAWIAAAGIPIVEVPEARALVRPRETAAGLQSEDRAGVYTRALSFIRAELGVWPEL